MMVMMMEDGWWWWWWISTTSHSMNSTVLLVTLPRYGCGVLWSTRLFVCMSVCLLVYLSVCEHISGTARPIFTKFCVQIPCIGGSVLLQRRCATLCTSGLWMMSRLAVMGATPARVGSTQCCRSITCMTGAKSDVYNNNNNTRFIERRGAIASEALWMLVLLFVLFVDVTSGLSTK